MKTEAYGVLVIDDEEPIRRLLQKELANSCREIHTAADGAAALAQMRSHWFDVILMDVRMRMRMRKRKFWKPAWMPICPNRYTPRTCTWFWIEFCKRINAPKLVRCRKKRTRPGITPAGFLDIGVKLFWWSSPQCSRHRPPSPGKIQARGKLRGRCP